MENENLFQAFSYPEPSGFGQLDLKENEKVILVTNDDGYLSKGIKCLVKSLRGFGRIIVCAPDSPRSGFSSSFTVHCPISLKRISDDGEVAVYSCSGTPVDCVKLAFHRFFHHRLPNLVVSGINHGGNDSICVMYSGTMGAVLEACVVGVPAVGFSLLDISNDADFSAAVAYTHSITKTILESPMPKGVALNVNIPKTLEIKGARVCRQGDGQWIKEFHYVEGDENTDEAVFQVTGEYFNLEPDAIDTDEYWLEHGYVSIVPTSVDYTHHCHIETFKYLEQ
ncbi:MAG: 5'/3'-nucleotidase SurE [Bacteroidales bacterium]|nr:5'/3'-nucleotidase SurE [Bacteroidales bacterium]